MKTKLWLPLLGFAVTTLLLVLCVQAYSSFNDKRRSEDSLRAEILAVQSELSLQRQKALTDTRALDQARRLARLQAPLEETQNKALTETIESLRTARLEGPERRREKFPPRSTPTIYLELMDNPRYVALIKKPYERGHKARLETSLGDISDEKRSRIYSLLADKDILADEITATLLKEGKAPGIEAINQSLRNERARLDAEIDEIGGAGMSAKIARIETNFEPMTLIDFTYNAQAINERLSYADTALNETQLATLVDVLKEWMKEKTKQKKTNPNIGLYEDQFLQRCETFLTPNQLRALKELQAEENAATRLRQLPKS